MNRIDRARLRELLFRVSLVLKGLDGIAEIAGGVALWLVSPAFVNRVVRWLTAGEISEDPHDLIANFLRREASRFSLSGEYFVAVYLLIHGVIKIVIVAALLKDALWAYPIAIVVFFGFIVYQIYQYTLTGGFGLIALSVFDAVIIVLVWLEYRALKARARL
jgi:uncharacterized membrane protein